MPTPKEGETKQEYIKRCIPYVMNEGKADDNKHAAAMCYGMWDSYQSRSKEPRFYGLRSDLPAWSRSVKSQYDWRRLDYALQNYHLFRSTSFYGPEIDNARARYQYSIALARKMGFVEENRSGGWEMDEGNITLLHPESGHVMRAAWKNVNPQQAVFRTALFYSNPIGLNIKPPYSSSQGAREARRLIRRIAPICLTERGGPGSGHHGHVGREGEVGGSAPAGTPPPTGPVGVDIDRYGASDWSDDYVKSVGTALGFSSEQMAERRLRYAEKLIETGKTIGDGQGGELTGEEILELYQRYQALSEQGPRYSVTKEGAKKGYWRVVDNLTGETATTTQSKNSAEAEAEELNSSQENIAGRYYGEQISPAGGKKQVGLTAARPGREDEDVFEAMREFTVELNNIQTIQNASVRPGLGGWEGGREPTWIIEYEGNGDALDLISETAREYDQDAALVFEAVGEGEEGSLMSDLVLSEHINPTERTEIENVLAENGVGGWTWMRTPDDRRMIRAVSVPQWGGTNEEHAQSMQRVRDMLTELGYESDYSEASVKVSLLDRENDYRAKEEEEGEE